VVGGSAAFYWLISTHELEQLSDWFISSYGADGSRGWPPPQIPRRSG